MAIPIANKGNRRLVINEVDRECECGEPVRGTLLIPPGATRNLTVLVNADGDSRSLEMRIGLTTNDPVAPRIELLVKAHITPTAQPDRGADQQRQVSVLTSR